MDWENAMGIAGYITVITFLGCLCLCMLTGSYMIAAYVFFGVVFT